jgi:hypothetical protein
MQLVVYYEVRDGKSEEVKQKEPRNYYELSLITLILHLLIMEMNLFLTYKKK